MNGYSWPEGQEKVKKHLPSVVATSISFFALQIVCQRAIGTLGLHAGVHPLLVSGIGTVLSGASLYATNYCYEISSLLSPGRHGYWSQVSYVDIFDKNVIRRTVIGLSFFLALEGRLGRTSFPSNSISLGAYAQQFRVLSRSVASNSKAATELQRAKIQLLGKRFGCHQCGTKWSNKFIADHMPPTKFVEQANKRLWRKISGIKMTQRLWPQCERCFSVQGSAVSKVRKVLIYHHQFRVYHLSPGIALVLDQFQTWQNSCDKTLQPFITYVRNNAYLKNVRRK
mmetsp:Transcript_1585/g.2620  ORF Transcript_1585/g.2620 Transcript_1585/m.2620 type:complete len:283 (+) Transcript_1585:70-918(+)